MKKIILPIIWSLCAIVMHAQSSISKTTVNNHANSIVSTIKTTEICNNGIDDDGDGLIDCYDPDCCADATCSNFYYQPCLDTSTNACTIDSITGTFSMRELWKGTEAVSNYTNPVVGDLDGDGIPEIVAV